MGNNSKGIVQARKKPKLKSIKTKAANLGSKRRLAKLGKDKKKGHEGEVTHYMSRTRAIKYLQITLRDFRRLCILKGIYPREPKKKFAGADKIYYHVKDISYLAHEPLLAKFRDFKSFMKKIHRRMAKKEHGDANIMYDNRPQYTLDHLVKERYPRFQDALADLDDALNLLHLFASLPAYKRVTTRDTAKCARLCREWQYFVVESRSLRKAFVSIKGIYYEANVQGQNIVWLAPHKFSQDMPVDVDYRMMMTFFEFYETLLGFVLYKLYHSVGLAYPPKLVAERDVSGEHLSAIKAEPVLKMLEDDESVDASDAEEEDVEMAEVEDEEEEKKVTETKSNKNQKKTALQKQSEARLKTLDAERLAGIASAAAVAEQEEESKKKETASTSKTDDGEEEDGETGAVFAEDEQMQIVLANQRRVDALTNLFKNLTFFVGREVPAEPLEFIISALGGKVLRQDKHDETDPTITHQITDRPKLPTIVESREYLQPQWVFDCVNNNMLLPVDRYKAGESLPPHLSPFVDDETEGHMPSYAADIRKLKEIRSAAEDKVALATELMPKKEPVVKDERMAAVARKRAQEEADKSDGESESEDEEDVEAAQLRSDVRRAKQGKPIKKVEAVEVEEEEEEVVKPKAVKAKKPKVAVAAEVVVKETKKSKKEAGAKAGRTEELFIKSKKFVGAKTGFVFQRGAKGQGYYKDVGKTLTYTAGKNSGLSKRETMRRERQEAKRLREMMMNNKAKRLYGKMQHGIEEKKKGLDHLKRKRELIEQEYSTSSQTGSMKKNKKSKGKSPGGGKRK